MEEFAGIQNVDERGKAQVDLYKLRAQEYHDRYENARSVEWNTLFQVYAAYAGLAIAFKYVFYVGGTVHPKVICGLAIGATTIFYAASRYLNYRVQERIMVFDVTRDSYMLQLDQAFHIPKAKPGTDDLGDRYFWTYRTHLALSTFTFVGLLSYEAGSLVTKTTSMTVIFSLLACALLLAGLLIYFLGCKVVPKKPNSA